MRCATRMSSRIPVRADRLREAAFMLYLKVK